MMADANTAIENMSDDSLRVIVRAVDSISDNDDIDVAGTYVINFDIDTTSLTQEKLASIALDIFHGDIAIGMLDDFEISVIDNDDQIVAQDEHHVSYSYVDAGSVDKISDTTPDLDDDTPSP